jgi:hypothetical protein
VWRPDLLLRLARVGMRLDGSWFCSPACVASVTRERLHRVRRDRTEVRSIPALRLGVLLLHQGAITSAQLAMALSAQRVTGRRLGAELQHMGLLDAERVLRGLSAQAGVSYLAAVDAACVRSAPGALSRDEVQALGVVPIQVDEPRRVVVVACQAPVRRAALSALHQLTGWAPEPLLVSDDDWQSLMSNYGAAAPAVRRRSEFVRALDVEDVVARVAAVAASAGTITVTEVQCDASTWVRVESPDAVNTLLLPYNKETAWPVVTTSH